MAGKCEEDCYCAVASKQMLQQSYGGHFFNTCRHLAFVSKVLLSACRPPVRSP